MRLFYQPQPQVRWFLSQTSSRFNQKLHSLPQSLKPLLLDTGSLTARLQALSTGKFHVEVIRQTYARASVSEALALGIDAKRQCLIREVILFGNNQPWVFARSLLPITSLTGCLRHLRKQGNQPLGAFLFSQPDLIRSPIALALISGHHGYLPRHLLNNQTLWGRRSVFSIAGKPLLVSEVFLPSLVQQLSQPSTTLSAEGVA